MAEVVGATRGLLVGVRSKFLRGVGLDKDGGNYAVFLGGGEGLKAVGVLENGLVEFGFAVCALSALC